MREFRLHSGDSDLIEASVETQRQLLDEVTFGAEFRCSISKLEMISMKSVIS